VHELESFIVCTANVILDELVWELGVHGREVEGVERTVLPYILVRLDLVKNFLGACGHPVRSVPGGTHQFSGLGAQDTHTRIQGSADSSRTVGGAIQGLMRFTKVDLHHIVRICRARCASGSRSSGNDAHLHWILVHLGDEVQICQLRYVFETVCVVKGLMCSEYFIDAPICDAGVKPGGALLLDQKLVVLATRNGHVMRQFIHRRNRKIVLQIPDEAFVDACWLQGM
jgi:hypothetical protein